MSFSAPRWLSNPHLQTMGAALPLWAPPAAFASPDAEVITFPIDAGRLVGRAWWQRSPGAHATALLLHGVGGTSESRYLLRAGVAFHRAGYHVVRLNLRGAGEGVREATSLYHAGLSGDVDRVVASLAADPRASSIFVVGFSLGGTMTLKLASEWGDAPPAKVRAVATISAPTDLVRVASILERRRTLPYRAWVVRNLVQMARAFARVHPTGLPFDPKGLAKIRTIREYDQHVVIPMHGFPTVTAYYEYASAGPRLASIRVPTLLVHADDDPMVPGATVAPHLVALPGAVKVAWSERGGHVGWVGGFREEEWVRTWAVEQVLTFFAGAFAEAASRATA